MTDLNALADYFRYFARDHAAETSPLYAALAAHVAEDQSLLRLAAKAKRGQPPANLLFAAVHLLLQQGAEGEELAAYYPSLGGHGAPDAHTGRLFAKFIWAHEAEIIDLIGTRVTNTNEVGRAGPLLLGFQMIEEEASAPLSLIEIGPSCGLVLCWDKYHYRFGEVEVGNLDCPVLIDPELRGEAPPVNPTMPRVASRTGLEMYPVDLDDPQTLAWQRALMWPEHLDRAARFQDAYTIAKATPMRIIPGDAVETISRVIEETPQNTAICVHHSFVMYQISADRKEVLSHLLCEASQRQPIWRLGFEWAGGNFNSNVKAENVLCIARYAEGRVTYQRLAFCDPHGRWIDWAPTAPELTDFL